MLSEHIREADVEDTKLSALSLQNQDLLSDLSPHDEDLLSQLSGDILSDSPGDASLTRLPEYVSGIKLRLEQQDDMHHVLETLNEV